MLGVGAIEGLEEGNDITFSFWKANLSVENGLEQGMAALGAGRRVRRLVQDPKQTIRTLFTWK